jgi:nucleoside-diphosphate-sugar epimerase
MPEDEIKTVLVTGGAGYIGSVLTGMLLEAGYRVIVLDRFFFGATLDHLKGNPNLRLVRGDIRWFDLSSLGPFEAVMDLAAISNDPAGELNPQKTREINHRGRERIAREAKKLGAKRYILASSCSIYGFQEGILDENSPVNPLTVYAEANHLAEQAVLPLADQSYCVTVLRQATVYGLSPRMRFDLAVNGMTLGVHQKGSVPILRDGTQWRPMVCIRDTAGAFLAILGAQKDQVNGELFNVGSDEQNFQIMPLAKMVSEAICVPFQFQWYGDPDHRSYRVSFRKIAQRLGYRTRYTPADAAREIAEALKGGKVAPDARTRTVEWYKHLIQHQDAHPEMLIDGKLL